MAHRLTRSNWIWQLSFLFFLLSTCCFAIFRAQLLWWQILLHIVLVGGNVLLLQMMTKQYELLGSLSSLPAVIYLLLHAFCPTFVYEPQAYASSICLLFSCMNVFDCYHKNECRVNVFNAFFFLGIAALFMPGLLVLIPVFWVIFNIINALNIRRIFASLLALFTIALCVFCYAFCFNQQEALFLYLNHSIESYYASIYIRNEEWILLGMLVVMSGLGIVHLLSNGHRIRSNSTRLFNHFLLIFGLCCAAMMIIHSPLRQQYLIVASLPFSVITGMYFNDTDKLFSKILAVMSLLVGLGYGLHSFLI